MIIGLTGKSGCGKSLLSSMLSEMSEKVVVLDIDKVGHQITAREDIQESLIERFGDVILSTGKFDRKKLGLLVFNDPKSMEVLTKITWLEMEKIIDEFIFENPNKIIILDWALIPKTKYFEMCDIRVLVEAPYSIRLERAIKRDGISEEAFMIREKASLSYDNSQFDYVIENSFEKVKVKEKVRDIYDKSIVSR